MQTTTGDEQHYTRYGNFVFAVDDQEVRQDALNEYISLETARDTYGVAIDPESFAVDETATADLRAEMKRRRA